MLSRRVTLVVPSWCAIAHRRRDPITTPRSIQAEDRGQAPYTSTQAEYGGTTVEPRLYLRLALGIEHRRAHGFGRALAGPDHELKCRIIAFAGVNGAPQHALALRGRGADPARQHQSLTVHDHAGVDPDVEMPDP